MKERAKLREEFLLFEEDHDVTSLLRRVLDALRRRRRRLPLRPWTDFLWQMMMRAARRALSSGAVSRHRPVMKLDGARPVLANDAFVAPNATVVGNVELWSGGALFPSTRG